MRISNLISNLESIKNNHGDIETVCLTPVGAYGDDHELYFIGSLEVLNGSVLPGHSLFWENDKSGKIQNVVTFIPK